eukprot:gene11385-13456_t
MGYVDTNEKMDAILAAIKKHFEATKEKVVEEAASTYELASGSWCTIQ